MARRTQSQREQSASARRWWDVARRELGWQFAERTVLHAADVAGRPLQLLSSRDAIELYRAVHRDLVAVIDLAQTRVLRDPRLTDRFGVRQTMRLSRLVAYKALYFACVPTTTTEEHQTLRTALADHFAAAAGSTCADRDPRSLPFIPFDLGDGFDENLALDTEEGQEAFRVKFGSHHDRRDAANLRWSLDPRAYHGRDVLAVKGRTLPAGFHWDVVGPRGGAHVMTAGEVWQLKRDQYLNVYPDMYVRTTRDGGRRVWPDIKK